MGEPDQRTAAVVYALAKKLGIEPLEIEPDVVVWLELEVAKLIREPLDELESRLDEFQRRVTELEQRDITTVEYQDYAQDLNYRTGFNDGQYAITKIVENALEDDPKTQKKLKKALPDRKPSHAFSLETRP